MKIKTLLIIKAAVCLIFGPLLLLIPGQILNILGTTSCTGASLTAREYGSAIIGNLFLAWIARNAEESVARNAIIWALFIYDAVAFIAVLAIQLSGGLNMLGWGIVFIYLFFTIGFGYFLIPHNKLMVHPGRA